MTSQIGRLLRGRGHFSRRAKPALCVLTLLSLSQAWPLGGLQRAAPVPFRASSFTPGQHRPGATAQRLVVCLYKQQDFPSITFLRFVAHIQVMLCPKGAAKTLDYPTCYRLAFIRQHYLDTTTFRFPTSLSVRWRRGGMIDFKGSHFGGGRGYSEKAVECEVVVMAGQSRQSLGPPRGP